MAKHTHKLAYVGRIEGEYGGSYELRWCSDCGALYELFGSGRIFEVIPEMNKEELVGCKAKFLKHTIPYSKVPKKVLGRGLQELMARPSATKLDKLFGGK